MRLLLVEDDELLAENLKDALTAQNYVVDLASDGEVGWDYTQFFTYDLVLLDVSLPKLDGITLCSRLRQNGYNSPILLLTAKDTSDAKVAGLDAGADDYVVKPCGVEELFARIRALLRRQSDSGAPILKWGKLCLDPSSCEVTYDSQIIPLSPKEYNLLELFLRNPRRVLRHSSILEHLWSFEEPPGDNTIRAHIKGLRRKLKTAGAVDVIDTVYGIGYRLKPLPEQSDNKVQVEQQTLAAVNKAWEKFRKPVFKRIETLEQAAIALEQNRLTEQQLQEATKQAHKLIGSLGMFGFTQGSQIAREIETWLEAAELPLANNQLSLLQDSSSQLASLVNNLTQELESKNSNQQITTSYPKSELGKLNRQLENSILIVDDDELLNHKLSQEAANWNFQVTAVTSITAAKAAINHELPDLVLLDLAFPNDSRAGIGLLEELSRNYPELPVLVLTGKTDFELRLEVARLGGKGFLAKPIQPAKVFEVLQDLMRRTRSRQEKILAVDDDPILLQLLQQFLDPWGVQLTTLPDPRQFWSTLEATLPDLLILDVEMPHFDGIELCKVVRNDSHWNSLPIIFLSSRRDAETIHQIYQAGADDYVSKPVTEPELVTRIFNRLERVHLLRSLNETDQLTGVANRRQSTKELSRYIRLSQSYRQPLCLAVLDLDHFRSINDRYGHSVGDQILKRLGQILKNCFRSEDIVARWGGEEFVVAMYGMSKQDGVKRLNSLLQSFRQELFPVNKETSVQVTFSAGVADYPGDGADLISLYRAADTALFQAKTKGRNRILAFS